MNNFTRMLQSSSAYQLILQRRLRLSFIMHDISLTWLHERMENSQSGDDELLELLSWILDSSIFDWTQWCWKSNFHFWAQFWKNEDFYYVFAAKWTRVFLRFCGNNAMARKRSGKWLPLHFVYTTPISIWVKLGFLSLWFWRNQDMRGCLNVTFAKIAGYK